MCSSIDPSPVNLIFLIMSRASPGVLYGEKAFSKRAQKSLKLPKVISLSFSGFLASSSNLVINSSFLHLLHSWRTAQRLSSCYHGHRPFDYCVDQAILDELLEFSLFACKHFGYIHLDLLLWDSGFICLGGFSFHVFNGKGLFHSKCLDCLGVSFISFWYLVLRFQITLRQNSSVVSLVVYSFVRTSNDQIDHQQSKSKINWSSARFKN